MLKSYFNAFQIGIIAGMRAMTAPALVSNKISSATVNPMGDSKLGFLHSSTTATLFKVAAVGELIGDKLPQAPSRIEFPGILGRIGSGALSGGALSQAEGKELPYGAVAGALGAAVGSYAFYYLRHWLTTEQDIPDPYVALAEDALTIGAGYLIVSKSEIRGVMN
ncbi:DUF4126 domain-containing protein [Spirosoma rhododendri]|uniref:DUF4126 domain-containing protein n=1 Tax=Spirosoma rhododendri TaxID=2728024 RepID=A0A7L5DNJ9_9BACT|nr:DUF4126 domain-containing protein [Spirosoma rhododendri]QJD78763.1 DUF4126 domain-containing protein [Spirosoma rhododendri]